jgi:hypothetical protein
MSRRDVTNFDDLNRVLRDIYAFQDYWTSHNIDFHGRQIKNAGIGTDPDDYVVLKQLPKFTDKDLTPIKGKKAAAGGSTYDKVTLGIGVGANIAVGNDSTPPFIWSNSANGRPQIGFCTANICPTGSDVVIDLLQNGTSIFGGTKLHLPAGTANKSVVTFAGILIANLIFKRKDVISANVTQVGATVPGKDVTIVMFCSLI